MDGHERRSASSHVLLDDAAALDLDVIGLPDDVEHHLRRVLRVRDGDAISVTDGAGRWRLTVARISSSFELHATAPARSEERERPVTIASAIPKGDRLDWMVQKAVEVGVDRLVLIDAERSAVRWKPERRDKQLARLRRIADEALRQSRRVWRTELVGPVAARDVLADAVLAEPGGAPIRGDEAVIAIGPEGGWTAAELALSPHRVDLGPNVLRTETAVVVAASAQVVQRS